jgi:hypothetical protein
MRTSNNLLSYQNAQLLRNQDIRRTSQIFSATQMLNGQEIKDTRRINTIFRVIKVLDVL